MKHHKTRCTHCRGKIEFPAYGIGEWIQCPHCSETTVLKRRFPLVPVGIVVLVSIFAVLWAVDYQSRIEIGREAEEAEAQAVAKQKAKADLAMFLFELDLNQRAQQEESRKSRLEEMQESMRRIGEERTRGNEERRKILQHHEIVSEMQEANRIARDAAFDARRRPEPVVYPKTDWYDEWQKQQALNGIRWELQQMRINQEYDNSYWQIEYSFPRARY